MSSDFKIDNIKLDKNYNRENKQMQIYSSINNASFLQSKNQSQIVSS